MFDKTWLVVLATLTTSVNLFLQYYFVVTYTQLSIGFIEEKISERNGHDSVNPSDHNNYYNHLNRYHLFEAAVQTFLALLSVIIGNFWALIFNIVIFCWNINKIVTNTYFINNIKSSVSFKFRQREALVKLVIHLAILYIYLMDMVQTTDHTTSIAGQPHSLARG